MLSLANYDFKAHIHLFKWQEHNLLLDVNSGAIHVLDDASCKFISKLMQVKGDFDVARECLAQEIPALELDEIIAEVSAAIQAGALFTPAEFWPVDLSAMQVKALCLNVAHACNMKCSYCFASQGDFGMDACLMSLETACQALDFLMEKSGAVKNLEVDFFGGEPLLVAPMLKDLVQYGRKLEKQYNKKINFTLTTNALLLNDEIIQFILDEKLGVILSLDGRPETNDRHRVLRDGSGSYDIIVPKIKNMVDKQPVSYYVRGTFSRKNLDFTRDLQHLVELGFKSISLEPAVGHDNGFSIQEEDLPAVLQEYENLTGLLYNYQLSGKPVDFFHYNLDLQKGPCLAKRISGCGAGVEYLVVTPSGDIYPCHQFVGEAGFLMGNVFTGLLDEEIRLNFSGNHLGNKKECRNCWARYFCGGGCHANAYHSNNDISIPSKVSCMMHRKRIEGAIYLEAMQKTEASFL